MTTAVQAILQATLNGEPISVTTPTWAIIEAQIVTKTKGRLAKYNQLTASPAEQRQQLNEIFLKPMPTSSTIEVPFHSDFGRHIFVGERVFVNQDCMFTDMGGIYLADDVLIGPKVSLITVNHLEDPRYRRQVQPKPIHVEQGAWIGAGAIVLPGITIGAHAIVGAGSVVTKDVSPDMVVVGNPARVVRKIKLATD